jgi:hypothetical protein
MSDIEPQMRNKISSATWEQVTVARAYSGLDESRNRSIGALPMLAHSTRENKYP